MPRDFRETVFLKEFLLTGRNETMKVSFTQVSIVELKDGQEDIFKFLDEDSLVYCET